MTWRGYSSIQYLRCKHGYRLTSSVISEMPNKEEKIKAFKFTASCLLRNYLPYLNMYYRLYM
jgi:hypothetical protein